MANASNHVQERGSRPAKEVALPSRSRPSQWWPELWPRAFLALIVSLIALGQFGAAGLEFRVSGQIEQQTNKGVHGIQRDAFEVSVRDNDWLISIHQLSFPPAYTNVMLLDYSSFHDGDCIYTFAHARHWNQILAKVLTNPKAPADWKTHPQHVPIDLAWAEKGNVPRADKRYSLPLLFYAYCSQNYLSEATGGHLEPPFFIDGRPNSFGEGVTNVPAYVKRYGKEPFLPEQIVFLHGTRRLLGPGRLSVLPEEWHSFTNAMFNVDVFTNVGDMMLPASFTLTLYSAHQSKRGEPLGVTTSVRLVGRIESVSERCPLSPQDMKPTMQACAHVTDERLFHDGYPLQVRYDTNRWLRREQVLELPQYKVAILEAKILQDSEPPVPRFTNPLLRQAILGCLILSTAFVACYFGLRAKQKPQQEQKGNRET